MDKLAPHFRPSGAIMDSEEDKLIDKSLHATLSLYIPAEKLGGLFGNWTRQKVTAHPQCVLDNGGSPIDTGIPG